MINTGCPVFKGRFGALAEKRKEAPVEYVLAQSWYFLYLRLPGQDSGGSPGQEVQRRAFLFARFALRTNKQSFNLFWTQNMRVFIAIELEEEVRVTLNSLLERLKEEFPGIRWVKPGNIHLTLRFLGEIPDTDALRAAEAAQRIAGRFRPFNLELGEPGSFGGREPRVLFLHIAGATGALDRVYRELEEELAENGFQPEDRTFRPHLTLGRRKKRGKGSIPSAWKELEIQGAREWTAEGLTVFSSELTRTGPVYTTVAHCPFASEGPQGTASESL